jgi:Zn-dependent protease with chaperone function
VTSDRKRPRQAPLESPPRETKEALVGRPVFPPWHKGAARLDFGCLALSDPKPAGSKEKTPVSLQANLRRAFWKGFVLPGCVLVLFAFAPAWLDHRLHDDFAQSINGSTRLGTAERAQQLAALEQIDFEALCRDRPPGMEQLLAVLDAEGITAQFARLHWGFMASAVVVGLHLVAAGATLLLSRRARGSHDALIAAYRTGWRLAMVSALVQTFLLIPLTGYGAYELTTLAFDRYFPQLILVMVLSGLMGLWRSVSILLRKVPLEFTEPLAREVTAAEAPELWGAVRRAAALLRTQPPDHILVGLQMNFYVTELAVKHGSGTATGRTLFLSQPLLRQLSPDEVMAIVGHELGHFIGEDTRITTEFYPLRQKAMGTIMALASGGWVGWTSVHALNFFGWAFGATEQAMSRERELLADRHAAELTSPATAARALVRLHVFLEAFKLAVEGGGPGRRPDDPYAVPLVPLVRAQLVPKAEFWTQLFEKKAPHPLDSHPELIDRLASLGIPIGPDEAIALSTVEVETAYARWLTGRDHLFAEIAREAVGEVAQIRSAVDVTNADYGTPEGRALLDGHFPERRWASRPASLWLAVIIFGFCALLFLGLAVVVEGAGIKSVLGLAGLVLVGAVVWLWHRHRGAGLVLRADTLMYGGWTRPLPLAAIESVTGISQYGSLTLNFRLKTNEPNRWKYALLRFPQRLLALRLSWVQGRHDEIHQAIHRYVTRQIAPSVGG